MTTSTLSTRRAALVQSFEIAIPRRARLSAAERRAALDTYYRQIISSLTDLEAFARLSDMAAHMAGGDTQQYLDDMAWLIFGVQNSVLGIAAGPLGRWLEMAGIKLGRPRLYRTVYRFGSSGFRADDKGNQVQHFWLSVALRLHFGNGLAEFEAWYHEWNAPRWLSWLPGTAHGYGTDMDVELSKQGIELGQTLAGGAIRPAEIGDWIRRNL